MRIEHKDAAALAAGYSQGHRHLEIAAITAFFSISAILVAKVLHAMGENVWLVLAAVLVAYLGADFVSGFVHWLADTWGSVRTPVLGEGFIRPFREHHVDQKAITRHDFVETNGNNCLVSLPMMAAALLVPVEEKEWSGTVAVAFIVALSLFVFATNQIHKWAHQDQPPPMVVLAQRANLILTPEHHAQHHRAPYDRNYCITSGWMNPPLSWVGFFRGLEWTITRMTGALPRHDDIGKEAALALAGEKGILPAGEQVPAAQAVARKG